MIGIGYTIEAVSTRAELLNLETDWNRLSDTAAAPNVFTTFAWFLARSERLARDARSGRLTPHVLVLKRGETIAGICSLVCRWHSRFGFAVRELEFAGNHADYNDLVLGDDPAGQISAVVGHLAQTSDQWNIVNLRSCLKTTPSVLAECARS